VEKGDPFLIEEGLRFCQKKDGYLGELKKALDAAKGIADALARDIKASPLVSRMERAYMEEMAKECVSLVVEVRRQIDASEAKLCRRGPNCPSNWRGAKAPESPEERLPRRCRRNHEPAIEGQARSS